MTQDEQRALAAKRSKEAQAEAKRVNAAHTPGPWQLWTSCSWRRFCTQDGSPVAVPTVARDGHPDLVVSQADALLIAAAPDLLTACQKMAEWEACEKDYSIGFTEHVNLFAEAFALMNAAINKATGTTPPSDTGAETP